MAGGAAVSFGAHTSTDSPHAPTSRHVPVMAVPLAVSFLAQVNASLAQELPVNASDTQKPKSTAEGMLTAYVSLVLMALLPIFVGAFKSVDHHRNQKQKSRVGPPVSLPHSHASPAGHGRSARDDDIARRDDVSRDSVLRSLWSVHPVSGKCPHPCLRSPHSDALSGSRSSRRSTSTS